MASTMNNGARQRPLARDIGRVLAVTAAVLLVPLAANRIGGGAGWSLFDFVLMGTLVAGTGLGFVLASRTLKTRRARMIAGAVLFLALALVWAELAVGIVGTFPFSGD